MKVSFSLSPAECERALKELEAYRKQILPKLDEVCKRLAEIGAQEALSIVNSVSRAEGNAVDSVETVKIENGYKIVMSGADVYFIEFGTGNSAGMFYGNGLPVTSVPVYPGSYSEQNSGMYARLGYWFYHGELMSSTDVYMPMYYAGKAIRENIQRVIQEVFGE